MPWVSGKRRHKMNKRCNILKLAKSHNSESMRNEYKKLRNEVTAKIRKAKSEYFKELTNNAIDRQTYWKMLKMANGTTEQKPRNVRAITDSNEKLLTDVKAIANILSQHFATAGERLAKEFIHQGDVGWQLVDRISPTTSEIEINEGN